MKTKEQIQQEVSILINRAETKTNKSSIDFFDRWAIVLVSIGIMTIMLWAYVIIYSIRFDVNQDSVNLIEVLKDNLLLTFLGIIVYIGLILMTISSFKIPRGKRMIWCLEEDIETLKEEIAVYVADMPEAEISSEILNSYLDQIRERNMKIKLIKESIDSM